MIEHGQAFKPGGIRAVIFDMDGVLTDSEPLINAAAIAMFKEKGVAVRPDDFLPFVGTGEDRYIGGVAEKYGVGLDLPAAKARTYEIYLELVPKELRAFPGALALVQACHAAGLRVAVASSADRVKIEANLRHIGLPPETWDALVWGEEVVNKKPGPDIFLKAAAKLGVSPAECVVIEDAVNGVEAAKAAGMRCVAVAQTFPVERLQHADLVRRNLLEVGLGDLTGDTNSEIKTGAAELTEPPVIPHAPEPSSGVEARAWGFWATLGFTLLILFAGLGAQVAAAVVWVLATGAYRRGTLTEKLESNGLLLTLATWSSMPAVVGLAYLFARIRTGRQAWNYLGFRQVGWKTVLLWSIVMAIMVAVSDGLTVLLGRSIVPDFMREAYDTAGLPVLFWLALVVVAPLSEETLFRGFFFEGVARSRIGVPGAIVLGSLLWALIHVQYDFYGVATIFFFGLLLGYVRFKTGSVFTTMFLHALMNLIATLETAIARRTLE